MTYDLCADQTGNVERKYKSRRIEEEKRREAKRVVACDENAKVGLFQSQRRYKDAAGSFINVFEDHRHMLVP